LRLYAPRAIALISAFPNRSSDFPEPQRLRDLADALPASDLPAHLQADLRDGLRALAQAIDVASGHATAVEVPPAAEPLRQRRVRQA
jgi:hypothetical protein